MSDKALTIIFFILACACPPLAIVFFILIKIMGW